MKAKPCPSAYVAIAPPQRAVVKINLEIYAYNMHTIA